MTSLRDKIANEVCNNSNEPEEVSKEIIVLVIEYVMKCNVYVIASKSVKQQIVDWLDKAHEDVDGSR